MNRLLLSICVFTMGISSASAQLAPDTMMKIVIRDATKVDPSSFKAKPKTIYRMGEKYGRIEELPDPSMKLHGLMIVREPKLWIINLMNKTGRLVIDPGPTFVFHSPILPPQGKAQVPPLPDFEFGKEYDFLKTNKAVKTSVEVDGRKYDSLSLLKDGYGIVLLSQPGTEIPCHVKVQKDEAVICGFIYDEYKKDLPPQMNLFEVPSDVKIVEAAETSRGKYPPKIGKYKFSGEVSYGSGKSIRYQSEGAKIDVFYYGNGAKEIKPGAGDGAKAEMEVVKKAIREIEKLGKYKGVTFEEDKTIEISGSSFIRSKCHYTQSEGMSGKLTSFTYLTVKDNNFFKVRATVSGEDKPESEKEILSFTEEAMKISWKNGLDLPESPENDKKILQMVKDLYDDPIGAQTADKLATVVRYADKSKRITVTLKEEMLDIKDKYGQLFTGFYVAGSARYYLEHPEDTGDKDKSDTEIKRYLVKLYQVIQKKDPAYKNQIYDGMLKELGASK